MQGDILYNKLSEYLLIIFNAAGGIDANPISMSVQVSLHSVELHQQPRWSLLQEVAASERRHSARFIRGKSWFVHHGGGEHGRVQRGESANPRRAILEQASPEKTEEAMQRNHWKEGGRGEERRGGWRER